MVMNPPLMVVNPPSMVVNPLSMVVNQPSLVVNQPSLVQHIHTVEYRYAVARSRILCYDSYMAEEHKDVLHFYELTC